MTYLLTVCCLCVLQTPPAPIARVERPVYQPKNRTTLKTHAKPKQSHVARSIFDDLVGLSALSAPAPASVPTEQDGVPHSALLQSLKILPDEDGDGLVDLQGQLKLLQDGELLDLTGRVKVGDLLDACVEVEVSHRSVQLHASLSCIHRSAMVVGLSVSTVPARTTTMAV